MREERSRYGRVHVTGGVVRVGREHQPVHRPEVIGVVQRRGSCRVDKPRDVRVIRDLLEYLRKNGRVRHNISSHSCCHSAKDGCLSLRSGQREGAVRAVSLCTAGV